MRIVLDTNVLVSGMLNARGSPGRVLDGVLLGELVAVVDDRILAEYRDVLARPKFAFEAAQREQVLEFLEMFSEAVVAPPLGLDLPDPDDIPFVEVAVHARVEALVTGNARDYPVELCKGVRIVSPGEMVGMWLAARR